MNKYTIYNVPILKISESYEDLSSRYYKNKKIQKYYYFC